MRSDKYFLISILIVITFASGCASTVSVTPGIEARVLLVPECPITGEKSRSESAIALIGVSLLSNLAGSIVGSGIDAMAQSLTTDQAATVSATNRYNEFFQVGDSKQKVSISTKNQCVVTIVGQFSTVDSDKDDLKESILDKGTTFWSRLIGVDKGLNQTIDGLADRVQKYDDISKTTFRDIKEIYFYSEHSINQTENSAYAAADPKHIFIGRYIGESSLFEHRRKDVKYIAEISKPGTGPFLKIEFEKQSVESQDKNFLLRLTEKDLSTAKGVWQSIGSVSTAPANVTNQGFQPVNVKTSYTETQKPGSLSKLVGNALSQQKKDVVTLVENETKYALSSTERQKSRLASLTDADKAYASYQTDYQAALDIQSKYTAAKTETEKSKLRNEYAIKRQMVSMKETMTRAAFSEAELPFNALEPLKDL